MELIALKKIIYGGKRYFAGDRFSARRKDALAFIYIGKAANAPVQEAGTAEPMLAEEVSETPVVPEEHPEEVKEEKPKRTRTYRRRDMNAEME